MDRAARAGVAESVGRGAEAALFGLDREDGAISHRLDDEGIIEFRPQFEAVSDGLGLEDADPVKFTALRDAAVIARHGAGRGDAAGAADLGGVISAAVPGEILIGREEQGVAPDRAMGGVLGRIVAPWALGVELHLADAMFLALRQPDPGLELQWCGDFVGEEAAERAAVDAAEDGAAEPADRQRVVAVIGLGIGRWGLGRQQCLHLLVIGNIGFRQGKDDAGQARAMGHDVPDAYLFLAVGCEFRPIFRDGRFEIDEAAFDQDQHAGSDQALGAGIDDLERVLFPQYARCCRAAPEVDDLAALMDGGEGGADIAAFREVAFELFGDRLEAFRDDTLDRAVVRDFVHSVLPCLSDQSP